MAGDESTDVSHDGVLPEGVRDGDVLVYMSGRLLVVDHLVPEAFTIDLVELHAAESHSASSGSRTALDSG